MISVLPVPIHFFLFLFLFLRKISPELTSATILLFLLRKTDPGLTSMPIFLHFICKMPTTAWLVKCYHVRTQDPNQRTPGRREAEHAHLTSAPPGWPICVCFCVGILELCSSSRWGFPGMGSPVCDSHSSGRPSAIVISLPLVDHHHIT